MFERVALIGLGLIGSSLAHAVKRKRLADTIAGYDVNEAVPSAPPSWSWPPSRQRPRMW